MIKGIVWTGVRTDRFDDMRRFLLRVTTAPPVIDDDGFAVFNLPDGDRFEIFGPDAYEHFTTGPVVGFLVDDVDAARASLETEGIVFLAPTARSDDGNAWAHFRAPDGNVYELTSRPDHPSHRTA
jgi:catechol 2,3-dioxygenase-like lactoylglutathione lyase family enzyme